jgi:hypothetical protein
MKNSDFDIDFSNGKAGEDSIAHTLNISTVEVKRDLKWFDTNNLFIEYECFNITQGEYIPSGLKTTKATHYTFVLGDTFVGIPTQQLKDLINKKFHNGTLRDVDCYIPPNQSRGYLVTIQDILEFQKEKGREITNG